MMETVTVQVETDGDEQIVRLPEAFRFPGNKVTVRRGGQNGIVIEPVSRKMSREEIEAIFAKLRSYHDEPFMPEGREQPPMPDDDIDL